MAIATSSAPAAADHRVHFFDSEEALAAVVAAYVHAPLIAGDAVIIIAPEPHRDAFRAALDAADVDTDAAIRTGALILADAVETLQQFRTGEQLDAERFDAVIGGLVRRAAAGGRSVHAYGEMVALLWEAGDVAGAAELEDMWNALRLRVPFALFCAYPAHLFATGAGPDSFAQVCGSHGAVFAGAPEPTRADSVRRFPYSERTPSLARRFVRDTLLVWGHDEPLVDAAMLVVAELVTNAVLHAGSDVAVALERLPAGVRISVGDTSDVPPQERTPEDATIAGRGLRVVAAIADGWNYQLVDGGKLVWAELHAESGR